MPPVAHAHKIKIEVEVLQRGPCTGEMLAQLERVAHNAVAEHVAVGRSALVQSQARHIPLYDAHDVQALARDIGGPRP